MEGLGEEGKKKLRDMGEVKNDKIFPRDNLSVDIYIPPKCFKLCSSSPFPSQVFHCVPELIHYLISFLWLFSPLPSPILYHIITFNLPVVTCIFHGQTGTCLSIPKCWWRSHAARPPCAHTFCSSICRHSPGRLYPLMQKNRFLACSAVPFLVFLSLPSSPISAHPPLPPSDIPRPSTVLSSPVKTSWHFPHL